MSEWGTHLPLKLVKNVTYPSYQPWANASDTKTPPQESMKITVLTVMAWLRERFRELPVPQALQTPDAAQYKEISLSDFPSLHINELCVFPSYAVFSEGFQCLYISYLDINEVACLRQLKKAVDRDAQFSACAIACVNSLAPDGIKAQLDLISYR